MPSYNIQVYGILRIQYPETGRQLLMICFSSQNSPDIRVKLKHLKKGPLTPQAMAFKVYHGKDKKAPKQKHLMLARAFRVTVAAL